MSDDWIVHLVVAWLPFLIFIAAVLWHGRQVRRSMTTGDGRSMAQAFEDLGRELKRANDLRTPSA